MELPGVVAHRAISVVRFRFFHLELRVISATPEHLAAGSVSSFREQFVVSVSSTRPSAPPPPLKAQNFLASAAVNEQTTDATLLLKPVQHLLFISRTGSETSTKGKRSFRRAQRTPLPYCVSG